MQASINISSSVYEKLPASSVMAWVVELGTGWGFPP